MHRGLEAYGAVAGAVPGADPGALQQPYPAGSDPSQGRGKATRRTYISRPSEGDEDYNSADGKGGRKRRYRVAEVRGSWTPEEDDKLKE